MKNTLRSIVTSAAGMSNHGYGDIDTSYTYAGTGYANPHAPTTIDGLTLTYDNNGNVTAYGTNTYTYDYLNRMSKSVVGGVTATSSYDHLNQRIKLQVGSTTTLYPSKLFSKTVFTNGATTTATTTAYIYVGDTLMALIDTVSTNSTTTATTTNFVHYDHLGSTNFLTNSAGATTSVKDYYPFGELRVTTGASSTDRQYIGERFDASSNLNYLNARMYDSARGQFTSQDPMFTGDPRQQNLIDPQSLNSYSYAGNNPVKNSDPSGKCGPATPICIAAAGGYTAGFLYAYGTDIYSHLNSGDSFYNSFFPSGNRVDSYLNAGLKSAFVAVGATGAALTAPLSITASPILTYLYGFSSIYSFATSYDILGNAVTGQSSNNVDTFGNFINSAVSPLGIGPRDIGRLPTVNPLTSTRFANTFNRESISNIIGSIVQSFSNSSSPASGGGGSAGTSYVPSQLGIGNTSGQFVGTYNFGPSVGTFNFGTGSWSK
jgi:RHS repeat-associated protein